MYSDFFLWYFNGSIYERGFIISQLVLPLIILLILIYKFIKKLVQYRRTLLVFKVDILRRIVAPKEESTNIFSTISVALAKMMFKSQTDEIGEFIKSLEKYNYDESLKKINEFSKEYYLGKRDVFPAVALTDNKLNRIKWKRYKSEFQRLKAENTVQ